MKAVNGVDANISARDVGEQVLKFFWDLASLNEDARAAAAAGLVAELKGIQAEFSPSSVGSKQQATYAPSLVYGLKRLVRGLASGRQGARQGNALALSKLLADIPALSINEVLATMASELEVSGQANGSEAHDQLLGQVFGYAAIIRSGLHLDQPTAVTCAEGLTHIANKKSFLRELAANVLLELTEQLEDTTLTHILEQESCGLKEWLLTPAADASPEVLLLALRLWGSMPFTLLKQTSLLPSNVQSPSTDFFTVSDTPKDAAAAAAAFFSEQHLQTVLPVLRGSSSSHPRLHSLWPTLFALLLPGFKAVKDLNAADSSETGSKGTAAAGQLEALWTVVVQDLFTSSHERKALGFQLFTILLPFLRLEHLPVVFSAHFLRCFTNNLTNSKTYLHSSAQRCAQRIVALADKTKASPSMQTALAVALQGVGGHGFDKLTKTTTVAKLLQNLDAASLEPYVQRLQDHFCKGSKSDRDSADDQEMEKARQVAVEQMCNMAAIRTVPASIKTGVLKFLAVHAFFVVDKAALGKGKPKEVKAALQAQPPPSAATRQVCAARLIALLDCATKAAQAPLGPAPVSTKKQSKTKKRKAAELAAEAAAPAATAEAMQAARLETPFLTEIVAFVSKVQRTAGVSLTAELPEEMDAALSQLRESEALAATKLAAGATGVQAQQVRSMVGLMRWLQLYILSDPAAAQPDVAADLQGVFNGAFTKTKPAADEPHWMDVLVDILLSLLGRSGDALPFGPLREACEALFRAFAEQVTSEGFADLVRVVQQPPEGQADEEDDEDLFGDDEEDTLAGSAEDGDIVDAAEGTDADSDEDDDEADGTAVDAALNAKEESSDSNDEEDFDDDQMFKMDDKIAAALRVMASGGANARESREAIATFKFRVMGLMEIYIKKVPSSPLLAAALPALLGALTGACQQGADAALAKRLHVLLMLFAKGHAQPAPSASGEAVSVPDGEAMAVLLKRTLYLASRHKDKKVTSAASTAFAYLLRCSITAEGNLTGEATTAVKAALDDFFTKKKSKLHRKLFEDIMARCALLSAATLLPAIVQHEHTARSGHVKADAIALLLAFLRSSKGGLHSADSVAEAFRRHVSVLPGLAVEATTGSVAQSARQNEALKDTCASFEQLVKIYPTESLQDVVGQHQIQLVLASLQQAEAAAPKPKVQVQLKRLAHLLSEKTSTVPFSQQVKSSGSKKANKKPNVDQSLPDAQPKAKGKVHKGKKAPKGQSKSSLAQAAPKIAKNRDKYKKKGNKDTKKGKPFAQN
ncbi:TPA: hypothetical protein ACH3X3_004628 [Trebouxia sp. C0006]